MKSNTNDVVINLLRSQHGIGLKAIFGSGDNPLPWVDAMLGVSHTNFFENRVVDYAKGALTGDWADVWGQAK